MKKLFNSRFLFILASSLVVLILLTIGAFYLFEDEEDTFVKSGYVLNPLSATSEKYFFNENVGYKENLSSMVEFKDVDENTVTVLRDSFIHYMDESMSFLKNGAILDLNSVSGDKAVSFYNITDESMIEKTNDGYVIESANGDIKLKNFVGRISEDKYIVVGDLSLKMAGNSTTIEGDYFEIVYVEEGIVNIENKSVKYQVAAADTLIYVGNNKVIDLGDKKITVDEKDVMSITSITIDGNENIEIVPKAEEGSGGGTGTGDGDGTGSGTGTGTGSGSGDGTGNGNGSGTGNGSGDGTGSGTGTGTGSGSGDGTGSGTGTGDGEGSDGGSGSGDGTGSGDGSGGTGNDGVDGEQTEDLTVSLKEVSIGSTNIDVIFDVINAEEEDVLKLQVVNLNSGRTVDMVAQVLPDVEIQVNLLTPNTKYLVMVINEKDNGKYFQKVFETTGFGIRLEKSYATDSSLAYKITVEDGTDIANAKLSLYKYNEETKQNEIVTTSYYDSLTGETKYVEKVTYLSNLEGNLVGEHEIIYDGLENNTIYTAVLDEFSVASSNFKDIYNITLTAMTLKKTPAFSEMTVSKDTGSGSFDLSLGNITDPDNAITKYTYMIYNKLDDVLAVDPIIKTNASPITVKVGSGENELKNDTNYYYKAIIEYYDNEKYIEYVTSDSITFMMGNDPYVTVVPNESLISYDTIGATIYLKDNSCMISMPGRDKCGGDNTTVVEVSKVNSVTGEKTAVFTKLVNFIIDGEEIKYDLFVDNLQAGTTYNIEVRANYNTGNTEEKQEILHTDESKRTITTKSLTSFTTDWVDMGSNATHVVNVQSKFVADEQSGTLSGEESADAIKKVEIKLYAGENIVDIENGNVEPLDEAIFVNTEEFSIKENFYVNGYTISTLDTFGLTLEDLRNLGVDGKLSEYYTITVKAYYDNASKNEVKLSNNILSYKISPILLMENIEDPVIEIEHITNKASGNMFNNLTNDGTHVGYRISAAFDRIGLLQNGIEPKTINFYVYNSNGEKLQFYVKNEDGNLQLVDKISGDLLESNYYETSIYMGYGTSYEIVDTVMRRGNSFYIGYEIETVSNGETWLYPELKDIYSPSGHGLYEQVLAEKETPGLKMYIAASDKDSITYSYNIKDPDNALYKESDSENYGFYTVVNNGVEQKLDITKVDENNNNFEGRITVSGLTNGDLYSLYYKKNIAKTGNIDNDVVNYIEGEDTGLRLFDGYYDSSDEKHNFKYKIINNQESDNKVVIAILADEVMLNRILSYKVNFTATGAEPLFKEIWKLSSCGDALGEEYVQDDLPRCFSVDYTELKAKGMQSKIINVDITALYDNGITGYDFKVGDSEDSQYKYMIMQTNSTEEGLGSYISFNSSGTELVTWSEYADPAIPRGYYTYVLNKNNIYYASKYKSSYSKNIDFNLSSIGYSSKYGILNPKMISVDNMKCLDESDSSCNVFSFNSITPKVKVEKKADLINGSVQNLTLSGIDLNDLQNEGTKENPEYYLYIETWNDETKVGSFDDVSRPALKIKIDNDNPTKMLVATIDMLKNATTYYFRVYAYMNKNNTITYTQLFDAGYTDRYEEKTYTFTSLSTSDVFYNFEVNHSPSLEIYGDRNLDAKINLVAYKNKVPFNFDIVYILCDKNDLTCGVNENQTNIFKKTVSGEGVSTNIIDSVDISEYNLEFNKDYYMYIYASVDRYTRNYASTNNNWNVEKELIILNRFSPTVNLRKLETPTFTATRDAILLDNGEAAIDFNIKVNDLDRTLMNGNYFIKLVKQNQNGESEIVGNMQLLDEEGNYYDVPNYTEYAFDATVINKKVRMTGLEKDTKYTFVIYNNAYINNYVESILPEDRIYKIEKTYTVYSTNDYGIAFGRDILYSATENSIIVTFLGGSSFDNVTEVNYTVGLWDNEETTSTYKGTFVIGENNKRFEQYKDSTEWIFEINPNGMKNILGQTFNISLSFKVKVPGSDPEAFEVLTSAHNPKFEGQAQYVEDKKN